MWVYKDYELINLNNIDSIEINIGEDDNQFELDFLKNDKVINFFFYKDEKELKKVYENIINGLRNTIDIKVLNIQKKLLTK